MPSHVRASRSSSPVPGGAFGLDSSSFRGGRFSNLSNFLVRVSAIEFVVIAATAFATSLIYSLAVLQNWSTTREYLPSALSIAALILLVSLSFRHYAALQTQPLHRFLWNGLGAV